MSTPAIRPRTSWPYWAGLALACVLVAIGLASYLQQLDQGLGVTGLGRDVTWGLYIAQFAFAEGLAAAAVVVLLPAALHRAGAFERIALPGVLLAISAVVMCMLFILVDIGQPARIFNVMLHPQPTSMMFWDMVSLAGYLAINTVIALQLLDAQRTGFAPPAWLAPLILLSIPWGFAVHMVSAFLLGGMPARSLWFTSILAPRFLASAFASSSAALLLIVLLLRRMRGFDAGAVAQRWLALVLGYALALGLLFMAMEAFTALYGAVPHEAEAFTYLYRGLQGHAPLAPLMWGSLLLLLAALLVLVVPRWRARDGLLGVAAVLTLGGILLDKGYALVVGGFVPTPLGRVPDYTPTLTELGVVAGIWGIGALILLVTCRMALAVRPAA